MKQTPDAGDDAAFANSPTQHIFHIDYTQPPQLLRDYLSQRYRWGRSGAWRASFYPARVRLNGAPVDDATVVQPGDKVAYLHLRSEEPLEPGDLPVLHEDEWLLALHKPDTVPVNPGGVFYFSSLAVLLRERRGEPELTNLHRLDLETSGVLLSARRRKDVGRWHQLFTGKTLRKTYRALVHGHVPDDVREVRGWLTPAGGRIQTRLCLQNSGKGHPTHTRILSVRHHTTAQGAFSEVELEPVTGKTNQLRVHLAHLGHPIVGDKKYHPDEGVFLDWLEHRDLERLRSELLLDHQALQCESLGFLHPFTKQQLDLRAPAGSWAAKIAPVL